MDNLKKMQKNCKIVIEELLKIRNNIENGTDLNNLVNNSSVEKIGDLLESSIPLTKKIDVIDTDKVEQVVETIKEE